MGISVMKEGEVMGRGVKRNFIQEQQIKQRLAAQGAETIAVIGSGPAGLLAAHAAVLAGREVVIFSKPDEDGQPAKSEVGPATYLHAPIPDLTSAKPDGAVQFVKLGTAEGYALKVYGDRAHPCSWSKFEEGYHAAWAMQPAYNGLWHLYNGRIVPHNVTAGDLLDFLAAFPVVINTAPLPSVCEADHAFQYRDIWLNDDAGHAADYADPVIVYDGTVGAVGDRYRSSMIFGFPGSEYAREVPGGRLGKKVVGSNCDCHPEVIRAGRWGEWRPGVLTHHAFEKIWKLMFDQFEGA